MIIEISSNSIIFELSKAITSCLFGFYSYCLFFVSSIRIKCSKICFCGIERIQMILLIFILSYLSTSYTHINFLILLEGLDSKNGDTMFISRETRRFVCPVTGLYRPIDQSDDALYKINILRYNNTCNIIT